MVKICKVVNIFYNLEKALREVVSLYQASIFLTSQNQILKVSHVRINVLMWSVTHESEFLRELKSEKSFNQLYFFEHKMQLALFFSLYPTNWIN